MTSPHRMLREFTEWLALRRGHSEAQDLHDEIVTNRLRRVQSPAPQLEGADAAEVADRIRRLSHGTNGK